MANRRRCWAMELEMACDSSDVRGYGQRSECLLTMEEHGDEKIKGSRANTTDVNYGSL